MELTGLYPLAAYGSLVERQLRVSVKHVRKVHRFESYSFHHQTLVMNTILLALYLFFAPANLPVGTEVILQPYTTAECPIVPFEAYQQSQVGTRWKVLGTDVYNVGGITYRILIIGPRFEGSSLPTQWPENAVRLAFVGAPR